MSEFVGSAPFGITEYYYNRFIIAPILISKTSPPGLTGYYNEIRESFACGLFRSSITLCRALLEQCLLDELLKNRDIARKEENTKKMIKPRILLFAKTLIRRMDIK